MLHKLIKSIAPIAALALGAAVSGCDMNINIDGDEGVPLAELDTSGDAPTKLVVAGPDEVILTEGDDLAIKVGGDAKAADKVRFTLKDGTLGILREKGDWGTIGKARVEVTMPAPDSVVLAGSGMVTAARMQGSTEITIAGTGSLDVARIDGGNASITIAGSGTAKGAGTVDMLDLTLAGSGTADMPGLKAANADITVAGSGEAAFASDGKVDATIMGSGVVRVTGRATCEVKSMGSGKIVCEAAAETPPADGDTADSEDIAKAEAKGKKAKKRVAKKPSSAKSRKA